MLGTVGEVVGAAVVVGRAVAVEAGTGSAEVAAVEKAWSGAVVATGIAVGKGFGQVGRAAETAVAGLVCCHALSDVLAEPHLRRPAHPNRRTH